MECVDKYWCYVGNSYLLFYVFCFWMERKSILVVFVCLWLYYFYYSFFCGLFFGILYVILLYNFVKVFGIGEKFGF